MKLTDRIKYIYHHAEFRKFVKFGVTGALNTFIDYGLYYLLIGVFHVNGYIAQIISYSTATVNSFFINKFWTFQRRGYFKITEFGRFIMVNVLSLGFSELAMWIFNYHLGINFYICKVLLTPVTILINFLGSRLFVFVDHKSKQPPEQLTDNK